MIDNILRSFGKDPEALAERSYRLSPKGAVRR
jgi:hypothetical protein